MSDSIDLSVRLSEELAERTPGRGHHGCDPFALCEACEAVRAAAQVLKPLAPRPREGDDHAALES